MNLSQVNINKSKDYNSVGIIFRIFNKKWILRFFVFTIVCFLFLSTAQSATITSTAAGGNWNSTSSWAGGVIPGSGDDVIILSTATITVTADASVKSLDVFGIIIVKDAITLTVYEDVTVESTGELYLSGNTNCTGSAQSTLLVYGDYTNFGISCFWKSWAIIGGNLDSPSASGIQNEGYLVVGGDASGNIDQTGGSSVYTINPNATVTLSGTTPITTAPTSPADLVTAVNTVIFGGSCGFTINGPSNATSCNGDPANFIITSTTATSPAYQWEEDQGTGWVSLTNSGVYSGVTTATLSISNATGLNEYKYRCKVTDISACSKYSYAATLTVSASSAIGPVGAISGTAAQCASLANQIYSISAVTNATTYVWSVPTGWTITAGAGTTGITVTTGTVGQNGNISVTASNPCSSGSNSLAVTVNPLPAAAGAITGTANVCQGQTGVVYNVTAIANATGYTWTLPTGASITAGANTNSITVNFSGIAVSGNITVIGTNSCGTGAVSPNYAVVVNSSLPVSVTAAASANPVCEGTAVTFTATPTNGGSTPAYQWKVNGTNVGVNSNTYNYTPVNNDQVTVELTSNATCATGSPATSAPVTMTVNPINTITLSSAPSTSSQMVCFGTPMTDVSYSTTGATGATFTGLPIGVTGNWVANTVTITGPPVVGGTYNFTVTLTGGCGNVSASGIIDVIQDNTITLTSAAGTDNQTICKDKPITDIVYTTTGATGAIFSGLPAGVTGSWSANTAIISGTPSDVGTFNYNMILTGGCGNVSVSGVITSILYNTSMLLSPAGTDIQTLCVNTPITNITYITAGATGATFSGLPDGVTGIWVSDLITIRGTPTVPGVYNYSVTLIGGCLPITSTGTIIVLAQNTITLTSAAGTDNQTACPDSGITNITYSTGGATGATFAGLPAGITGTWASDAITISGSSSAQGNYNYTITLTGGCGSTSTSGTIVITPSIPVSVTITADANPVCSGTTVTFASAVTNGGASPVYQWKVNGTIAGTNSSTYSYAPSNSDVITLTVTSGISCNAGAPAVSSPLTLTVNSVPSAPVIGIITQPSCATSAGSVILSGLPSGNWTINPGSVNGNTSGTTISGLAAGTYNFTVTTSAGCISPASSDVVIVAAPSSPTAPVPGTVTQPTCSLSTGSVVLTGLPAGNWTINPGAIAGSSSSTTISGLAAGTYNFTVTSASGCTSVPSSAVLINAAPAAPSLTTVSQSNVSCNGGSNGGFSVTGSGGVPPYQYKTGTAAYQPSGTFENLRAGTYTVTIQDANLCTSAVDVTITEPQALSLTYTTIEASCPNKADGQATLTPAGGTSSYTALWSDGSTSLSRNDLLPGTNQVIITDANNCSASFEVVVAYNTDGACLEVQEIITPNNDGFYDTWKIKNIEMYPDAEVQVFNRWGEKVFSTKNISANEWDGTYNGKPLPMDSYHYVLYLEKGAEPITGTVSIIR
jgi:gliding motility-associated-like protein